MEKLHYSFMPGLWELKVSDVEEAKKEIMKVISEKELSRTQFWRRSTDWVNIPAHIKLGIENVFEKYGVQKEDVWEITDDDGKKINE